MEKINLTEQELFNKLENWITNNVEAAIMAQNLSKNIKDKKLINNSRPLPFEIVPIDNTGEDYNLIVYLDHPRYGTVEFCVTNDEVYFNDDLAKNGSKVVFNQEQLNEYVELMNDADNILFQEFLDFVDKRNYTEINKIINSELSSYKEFLSKELIEIKKYLNSVENIGLTNPQDGSVSYLNRVMGRWDLALLWENCPFVVISDPNKTKEVERRVNKFKNEEKNQSGLIHSMQKSCLISNMDVQVITDSKENEMDASGWLTLDEMGVPQVGPLIHVVKINILSKLEGNLRKGSASSKLII